MQSVLLEQIKRLDTVFNIGYRYMSVFNPILEPKGSMVFATNSLPLAAGPIISDPYLMEKRRSEMVDRLMIAMKEQELDPLINETFSMLYTTNLMGIYEMVKGLKRGLGVKPARRIIDKVYYKGAYDDINAIVKYIKEREK